MQPTGAAAETPQPPARDLTGAGLDRIVSRALLALALLGLVLALLFGLLANRQYDRLTDANRRLAASLQSQSALSTSAASFVAAEQALINQPDGAESGLYQRANERLLSEREKLKRHALDNPDAASMLDDLVRVMDARLERARMTRQQPVLEGELYDLATGLYDLADAQRAQAVEDARRAQNTMGGLALAAFLTALALAGLILWLTLRTVLRLAQSRQALDQSRSELLAADSARSDAVYEQERVESLLEDMNHRIGNSLGMVSALMGLQRSRSQNDDVRAALDAARSRIASVATAHRRLRITADQSSTDLQPVLQGVAEDLTATMPRQDIELVTDFVPMRVSDRDAVTLGLLMSELVTNAFKHAFEDRDGGTVWTRSGVTPGGGFILTVEDDGHGMPPEPERKKAGLGTSVIQRMSAQYGGAMEYEARPGGGTAVTITLPQLDLTQG